MPLSPLPGSSQAYRRHRLHPPRAALLLPALEVIYRLQVDHRTSQWVPYFILPCLISSISHEIYHGNYLMSTHSLNFYSIACIAIYILPSNACGNVLESEGEKWKIEGRKEQEMTKPLTLPPMDEVTLTEMHRRYEESPDAETRTRYQMLLLSLRGQKSSQIAHTVLRSQDTVERVLKRYLAGGLDAVPRRTAPGRERTVTAAWEAELLRVIEVDPHEVGQDTANWTTERLADYLGQQTGIQVTEETVRVYLHAHDYVCKRPTWTLRRKAEQKADYVGNACG